MHGWCPIRAGVKTALAAHHNAVALAGNRRLLDRHEPRVREFGAVTRKKHRFTFIDLFAGIGGMRLAFERVGGHCVFSSEYDPYPAKMYAANFGEAPSGDITKIPAEAIPEHDVLVGGFPCQPFSLAGVSKKNSLGREHGFACRTQGTLFFDVARIIAAHRPRMFLLENVKNLVSHDRGATFRVILETLENELGYTVHWKVIDAASVVPQHRERIYIVGFRDGARGDKADGKQGRKGRTFAFPPALISPTAPRPELRSILSANGAVDARYTLSDKLWAALRRHADNHRAKGNGFGYGLVGPEDRARTLSARYYKDGAEILIRQPGRNPRRLTPPECARLMGFPDDFQINLSDTRAYKCFGNSVVVPVAEQIAAAMADFEFGPAASGLRDRSAALPRGVRSRAARELPFEWSP